MAAAAASAPSAVEVLKPESKLHWGPKVWRFLHLLAEVSNRRDIVMIWRAFLPATAEVIPCAKCKRHFKEYLAAHPVAAVEIAVLSGKKVQLQLRQELRTFHNHVNSRLGKSWMKEEAYMELYTKGTREERLLEIKALFDEIKKIWTKLQHSKIAPAHYSDWVRLSEQLLVMVRMGPTP